jgi:hypothetical protein
LAKGAGLQITALLFDNWFRCPFGINGRIARIPLRFNLPAFEKAGKFFSSMHYYCHAGNAQERLYGIIERALSGP